MQILCNTLMEENVQMLCKTCKYCIRNQNSKVDRRNLTLVNQPFPALPTIFSFIFIWLLINLGEGLITFLICYWRALELICLRALLCRRHFIYRGKPFFFISKAQTICYLNDLVPDTIHQAFCFTLNCIGSFSIRINHKRIALKVP